MTRFFKMALFAIIFPLSCLAQVDLTKGLVAYYPFNGNANDASGNNNNPVFNNATLTSDFYGTPNSAYYFNGTDNYIQIPNNVSLNPNTISLCAWIKPTGFYYGPCHGNSVIMKGDADFLTGNYLLRFDDAFYTGNNCSNPVPDTIHETVYGAGTGLQSNGDTPYIQKNIWRSLVYTYDGSHARLYVDCELILDFDQPGLTFSNSYDLFLGRLNNSQFPYWFNGVMDEVRIYNRALNEDEVKAYSFSCADEEPCSNWAYLSGKDPGIQIGDLDIPGNKITVEALFNRIDSYDINFYGGDIVSKHTDPTDVNYVLRPTRVEVTTTTGWHGTPDVCDFELNKTYYVAMVYDGKTLSFYRNGYLMSQTPCTGNMAQNNWITRIGSTAAASDQNPTDFHGYISEVRIWNVARTQGDIRKYMNQPLPNPSTQNGLLAYYTFDDLKNKQGNSTWDGKLLNSVAINQTNPACSSFIADSCEIKQTNVIASFTAPDTVCVNTPVQITNTSSGASNYYWSFCAADFNTIPQATNIGNPGSLLNAPVFMDYALDDNGNYYGFVVNYNGSHLIRLDYGNSLLNNPTAKDLGTFAGIIPPYAEGVQAKKQNGNCYVFVVSAGNSVGSASVLVRIDFGSSFSNNSPAATGLGNVGGLNFPHELFIFQENANYYGFTVNINDNTLTRFDFGTDLSNAPTGSNLGNLGRMNYPCGFSFVNSNSNWYAFVTNRNSNSITRLDFGNSLGNNPTGKNIGNPGNLLNKPRDISIFESCSGIVGLVVNEEDEQTGTITKLDFGSDLLSNPLATSLGNLGNLKFPHSISKFFLEQNDIYAFITNVTNNSITRLRYKGCTNSSIASSTQQTPPPVTYDQPGVYNINLFVDIGLPTETSFCKQIVVIDCNTACDSFKVNAGKDTSVCLGASVQLHATGADTYIWNASSALSDTTIANPFASPKITTQFVVRGYDSTGCVDTDTVRVKVLPLPVFSLTNDTAICVGGSVMLQALGTGIQTYNWIPPNGLSNTTIYNPIASPSDTTKYFVTVTDSNGCKSTDSVVVNVLSRPTVSTINDTSICKGSSITLKTNATGANSFKWVPPAGLNNANVQSPQASPLTSTLYTVTAGNGICSIKDSVMVNVLSLPSVKASNDTTLCGNGSAQLNALGAISYSWLPPTGLSNPNIPNPVAKPPVTTTYYVTGTGNNGCTNKDSVTVTVQPDPVFDINPKNTAICSGDSTVLSASGGDMYKWSPPETVSNTSSAVTTVFPGTKTVYQVIIINTTCKVSDTLTSVVDINPSPDVTISKSNDIDCDNLQAQLHATGGIHYSWSPSSYINNTQIADPVVDPLTDTWYTVTVTGSNGCISEDSILVKSSVSTNTGSFYVPNAFTPNGDGINDCFGVRYWGPADVFEMSIYNKWGQLIYHSRNINDCWDGTIKGMKQASGTYVYQITVSSNCSHGLLRRKGTIVLIR